MGMITTFLRTSDIELEEYKRDSSLLENRVHQDTTEDDPHLIDIEKAWDGIIFLLTGQNFQEASDELLRVVFSGQILDEEQDLGYGPAFYLYPFEVKYYNEKISSITTEELKTKFLPNKMTAIGVYPDIWQDEDAFEYLVENFKALQSFYKAAAENHQAIISFLN